MKKLALYFVSFCSFFFVGCSDNSPTPTQLTVMFNTNGGSAVTQQTVEENKKATKPADPTKALYTFEGWYSDEALTTSFDFETPITANTTLYAKWTEKTFTVTYKSDASTEVGTEKVSQVTPTLTKNNFAVDGKYMVGFFSDETKNTVFTFPKELTAGITIYVTSAKDVVTPTDRAALVTEVDKAIAADGNSPDLNYINTEKVTDMSSLFIGKTDFNGNISLWNVGAVKSMESMFFSAINFNGDISLWKVSAVTTMTSIFTNASNFSGDLSKWDVSAVTHMTGMFQGASNFNSDISKWNVRAVTDMSAMFSKARMFNADISGWDVRAVNAMSNMFNGATAFNRNLEEWKEHLPLDDDGKFTGTVITSIFKGSGLENNPPSWDPDS